MYIYTEVLLSSKKKRIKIWLHLNQALNNKEIFQNFCGIHLFNSFFFYVISMNVKIRKIYHDHLILISENNSIICQINGNIISCYYSAVYNMCYPLHVWLWIKNENTCYVWRLKMTMIFFSSNESGGNGYLILIQVWQ